MRDEAITSIALLGRPDAPVDALEDYVAALSLALAVRGIQVQPFQVEWQQGRVVALWHLWSSAREWRGRLVLIQYTALQWSRRGFPGLLFPVRWVLHARGARIGVVFHDPGAFPVRQNRGAVRRIADYLRRWVQERVMRSLERRAELAVFTVPTDRVAWLRRLHHRHLFVPVGSNVPAALGTGERSIPTIAVFAVSSGERTASDVAAIAGAARRAAAVVGRVRLVVFGRNADDAHTALEAACAGAPIELVVRGVQLPGEAARTLADADVLLFVRGHVSSRRGSVIAALAHGLPVVGFSGQETAPPITEAGVALVPEGDHAALAERLAQVLNDCSLRQELSARSRSTYAQHFDWNVIAAQFADRMRDV